MQFSASLRVRALVSWLSTAGVFAGFTLAAAPVAQAAFPTAVNSQITDSVTQVNVKVLGDAPAVAMGNLFQAVSQSLSFAAANATSRQQQAYIVPQAATTAGINVLYSIDTASVGPSTKAILGAKPASLAATKLDAITIPPEGFLAGAALFAFDNDGVPGTEPDFWVIADEGFDFFRSSAGDLVLIPAHLRTIGNAAASMDRAVIWMPPSSVEQYFSNIFNASKPGVSTPSPAGGVIPPLQYYFGMRDTNGDIAYFGSNLSATLPEPGSLVLLAAASFGVVRRRRRTD